MNKENPTYDGIDQYIKVNVIRVNTGKILCNFFVFIFPVTIQSKYTPVAHYIQEAHTLQHLVVMQQHYLHFYSCKIKFYINVLFIYLFILFFALISVLFFFFLLYIFNYRDIQGEHSFLQPISNIFCFHDKKNSYLNFFQCFFFSHIHYFKLFQCA